MGSWSVCCGISNLKEFEMSVKTKIKVYKFEPKIHY